jgi:hypothetical protein
MNNSIDNNTIIISDLEGSEFKIVENTNYMICGDIIDSTYKPFMSPDALSGLKSNNLFDNINNAYTINNIVNKSYNLNNIIKICNNNKVNIVLGNRDLNKIKCLHTNKIISSSSSSSFITKNINNFNNGNYSIIILYREYINIYDDILKDDIIWNNYNDIVCDSNKPNTPTNNKENKNFFIDRFNKIFTVTLACNKVLLHTILYELYINFHTYSRCTCDNGECKTCKESQGKDIYTNFFMKGIGNENKTRISNVDITEDFLAFILLTTFNSLLSTDNDKCEVLSDNKYTHLYHYKGYLHSLYKKGNLIKHYINNENNSIVLFSHGGVTKYTLEYLSRLLLENSSEIADISPSANVSNIYTCKNIINKINSINSNYKNLIDKIFREKILIDINKLIGIVTPGPIDSDGSSTPCYQNLMSLDSNFRSSMSILSGFKLLNENNLFIVSNSQIPNTNYKIIQIIGHQPFGFGTGIKYYRDLSTYVINLDTTNSLKNTPNNQHETIPDIGIGTDTQPHHNEVLYTNNTFHLKSFINLNLIKNTPEYLTTDELTAKIQNINSDKSQVSEFHHKIYIDNDIKTFIEKENKLHVLYELENSNSTHNDITNTCTIKDKPNVLVIFHGYLNNPTNNYVVCSIIKGFNCSLFIITKEYYNTLCIAQVGGNNEFKNKYLKYKYKYLQLKNKLF